MALSIASVGCDWLDDDRIDDIEFGSSDTLLGRDVVLLDLVGRDLTWRGAEYRGAPSLDSSDSARLESDITRRKGELSMLLDGGATLILFVPAPHHWYVDTGVRSYSGVNDRRDPEETERRGARPRSGGLHRGLVTISSAAKMMKAPV